jgi:hypothetical protein
MEFNKKAILGMIKDPAQLEQAVKQLPDMVDHEDHADLLQGLGVNVKDLLGKFGGGQPSTGQGGN